MSGKGKRAGPERLLGEPQQHDRVLAAGEEQHRRSSSAATSRMMWIASDSSARRWLSAGRGGRAATLTGCVGRPPVAAYSTCRPHSVLSVPAQRPSRPTPGGCTERSRSTRSPGRAAGCREGRARGCAARCRSRSSARAGCTSTCRALVAFEQLGAVRARRALLAAQARDPASAPSSARSSAATFAAEQQFSVPSRARRSRSRRRPRPRRRSAARTRARSRGLREQHAGVDRDDLTGGRVPLDAQQLVDQHRLLLLEGAEQRAGCVALELSREGPSRARTCSLRRRGRARDGSLRVGQTAHSPSPRITWKGTLRFQSMNWFIVSRQNSAGIERSLTGSRASRCRRARRTG